MKDSPDGYTTTFTPTETGPHKVEVNYDKKPVDKSPFTVNVEAKKKPGVEVKGLEKRKNLILVACTSRYKVALTRILIPTQIIQRINRH